MLRSRLPFMLVIPLLLAATGWAATDDPTDIFTYVFDTGTPSKSTYPPGAILARSGWTALEEEDTTHNFAGDAILRNDRLVVAIRRDGQGAEVYARTRAGQFVHRARIRPVSGKEDAPLGPPTLEVTENSPGLVALSATYPNASLTFRLVTGQVYVQIDPGEGVNAVDVMVPTQWLVVPDFFADDLVYSAATARPRVGLPAENFILNLVEGGEAVVTSVWASSRDTATALMSDSPETRAIVGSRVSAREDSPIWVSFLEAPGVWYTHQISGHDDSQPTCLDWQPPFPAEWRADFTGRTELARSCNFQQEDARSETSQADPACWFQDGRAYLQRLPGASAGPPSDTRTHMIVYPIDRTPATPLNIYCLVDIMRSTLGVGACQYILDVEGLDAESTPTPAKVAEWLEKLFKKQRDARYADAIAERCAAMADHVAQADKRISEYAEFALMGRELAADLDLNGQDLAQILDDLDHAVHRFREIREAPETARALAERLTGLIGQPGAYEICRDVADRLRALGHAQDRTLSSCRMNVRRLDHLCHYLSHESLGQAETIGRLLKETQRVLRQ